MTTITPEMIERAARAVEPHVFSDEYAGYWPDRAERNREEVRRRVRIVLEAALGEGVTGWRLVPAEPTDEMYLAALRVTRDAGYGLVHDATGGAVYRAMLAASPSPAQAPT